jgi:hypothetical protein
MRFRRSRLQDYVLIRESKPQSTYIHTVPRVPQCRSSRWNCDPLPPPAPPLPQAPSPRNQKGGAHSPAGEGVGESHFQRLEKSLALCLLVYSVIYTLQRGGFVIIFTFLSAPLE